MKTYRLEGEPQEAEMVECEFGEYVKREDADELRELVKLITVQEMSDNGRLFYSTHISSCRCMSMERIGQILEKYRPIKHQHDNK